MKNGLFIVVDGIDGSGKSEIVKMLHNYLFSKSGKIRDFRDTGNAKHLPVHKKYRILTTREPTDGNYGSQIREMLKKEKDPKSNSKKLIKLFIKDRQQHLKNTIEPFLKKSNKHELNIALCDRYYYSTIAFQSAQGINMKDIITKNKMFRKPDITFILDVEPYIALGRIASREKEKFEQLDFMEKIRENFLKLPKVLSDNIRIIDSSRPLKNVFEDIKKEVNKLI
ncbi:MAG: dTMP kinase [Nanoarchaeota archaeon]|nr:dTMP kinase [Nanoarchaeota archaeon]